MAMWTKESNIWHTEQKEGWLDGLKTNFIEFKLWLLKEKFWEDTKEPYYLNTLKHSHGNELWFSVLLKDKWNTIKTIYLPGRFDVIEVSKEKKTLYVKYKEFEFTMSFSDNWKETLKKYNDMLSDIIKTYPEIKDQEWWYNNFDPTYNKFQKFLKDNNIEK